MPALENSDLISDTEESSQGNDPDDIPKGQTFHLNSKRLNVARIKRIAEALNVPTGAAGDEIRQMLDEKLSTMGYEPGNVQVVVQGKTDSGNLYLINESGIIKCIESTMTDHVQDAHVTVEGVTQGDDRLRSALREAKSECASLSNELTEAKAGLQAYETLVEGLRRELATEDPCVTCHKQVKESDESLACDLCDRWEHVTCVRQCDRLSESLYAALVGCRSKALLYVCSACRRGGSVAKKFLRYEVELACANDERLASARKLAERDSTIESLCSDKQQLVERTTALEREITRLRDELTKMSVRLEGRVTKSEGDDLPELESTSEYPSDSDNESTVSTVSSAPQLQSGNRPTDSRRHSSKRVDPHPPGFRALCTRLEKFSGRTGDNDFEVWVEDFKEATADCGWNDQLRARWFSWFLAGPAKSTWQRTLTREDKTSWSRIVAVYRGQYGVHLDPRTAYQRCHELQYSQFGSA